MFVGDHDPASCDAPDDLRLGFNYFPVTPESRFPPSLSPVRERMKVRVRVQRAISRAIHDSVSASEDSIRRDLERAATTVGWYLNETLASD